MVRNRVFRTGSVLLFVVASFSYGYFSHRNKLFPYGIITGVYRRLSRQPSPEPAVPSPAAPVDRDKQQAGRQKDALSKLAALPYLAGYNPAPAKRNVTVYKKGAAYDGLNLYVTGHASQAFLMDMTGNVLHTWKYDFRRFRSEYSLSEGSPDHDYHWRRVHLFENGDLLAIYEGVGLVKLDKNSNLLWTYLGGCHHDIFVTDDGSVYVLNRKESMIPAITKDRTVLEDMITILDPDGKERRCVSIVECFANSPYAPLLSNITAIDKRGDVFHTNTIEVFDGSLAHKSPLLKKGNVLISVLKLDTIAIIDLAEERVVWALTGMWKRQHEPALLPNGNMLIFDNQGNNGKSQVIEFEPFTQRIVWQYKGDAETEFFSKLCGTSYRLPNGNTLITESTKGRSFEVTPDNEIVWEFLNPHRAGLNRELIATLFDVVRLGPGFTLEWAM